MTTEIKYETPEGYTIIANRIVLMLVKTDAVGDNPAVYAVCTIADGEQELLRRFHEQNIGEQDEKR